MPGHNVCVGQAAAKDIQCAADGTINLALSKLFDAIEIVDRSDATGVGDGYGGRGQERHEIVQYSTLESLDIHAVDEEFVTVGRQRPETFRRDGILGKDLPLIGDDVVRSVVVVIGTFPTGQIEHETFLANELYQPFQTIHGDLSVTKDVTGDNNVRGSGIEPFPCVGVVDTSPDLQGSGSGAERGTGRVRVARTQENDVSTSETIPGVAFGKFPCRTLRRKVRGQFRNRGSRHGVVVVVGRGAREPECRPDDLFDLAVVQVNAWTKLHGLFWTTTHACVSHQNTGTVIN